MTKAKTTKQLDNELQTLTTKQKIEQHEHHVKAGVNSSVSVGCIVTSQLIISNVLVILIKQSCDKLLKRNKGEAIDHDKWKVFKQEQRGLY